MHKIDEILKALGATGAPPEAGDKTVKVAAALNQDAKDNNVLTKTDTPVVASVTETPATTETPAATTETPAAPAVDLVPLVRSLAEIVQQNNETISAMTSEFSEIKKTLERNETALAKLAEGGSAALGLTATETSETERQMIQRTKEQVDLSKTGQTEVKFSPSGAVIRPRTPVN